jgi:hypothetical protein
VNASCGDGGIFIREAPNGFDAQKKTARTSQKEEEVGELPRATEVTGGRRSSLNILMQILQRTYCVQIRVYTDWAFQCKSKMEKINFFAHKQSGQLLIY